MQKKVVIELEIEAEFESSIYVKIGDMLAVIEDSDFEVKKVEADNYSDLTTDIGGTFRDVVTKAYRYNSRV